MAKKKFTCEAVANFPNADECQKLLENGWNITLFRNRLKSITAVASRKGESVRAAMENDDQITDDFTPSKALHRLTEKLLFGRVVDGSPKS